MPPVNKIIKFKPDTAERKQFFNAASFGHPAKMIMGLQVYLIEHYTKPGDTILDPMAGSGTALIACTLGRNVILVELEDKFVKMQQDNWAKIKQLGPMLGFTLGQATIIQGDARNLEGIFAQAIVFSPPYANRIGDESDKNKHRHFPGDDNEKYMATYPPGQENIGNLKSDNYLEAMLQVYQQCHKVLKDKGLMCLVVKNFIRDKKIVRLDLDTIKLCGQAGFRLKERLKREITHQSFWRTLYYRKYPTVARIDCEDILVFES